MTKPLSFLLFFILSSLAVLAQRDTMTYFMKNDSIVSPTKSSANFIRKLVSPDSVIDKNLWYVNDLYFNGKTRLTATSYFGHVKFKSGLQGVYTTFFENGNKKCVKHFSNGSQVGEELDYSDNGVLLTSIEYDQNKTGHIVTCRDSSGKVTVENGAGRMTIYSEDAKTIKAEGLIVQGVKSGNWNEYANDEKYITVYDNGNLISTGKTLEDQVYFKVDIEAKFKGGMIAFYYFVGKTLQYPVKDRESNAQGKVTVTFIVEKNGKLSEIKALSGPSESLMNESVRVIALSTSWKPAKINGQLVRSELTLPITFTLAKY